MRTSSIPSALAAIGLLILIAGCSSSDPTASGEGAALEQRLAEVEGNERAFFDAFFAQDLDALMATYTEDAVFVDETFDDWIEGTAALTSFNDVVLEMSDPEASEVLDHYVSADGTRATSVWSWIGTSYYGNPFNLPMVLVNEYEDGLISKQTIYYGAPDAWSQLATS